MDSQFSTKIKQNGCVPWDGAHMRIGTGYDVATLETLPSPFCSIDDDDDSDQDVPSKFEIQAQFFRNQEELADYLESFNKATVSYLTPASMIAMANYIKSVRCSTNSMCLVMRCAITTKAEHFHEDLDLTDQAQKILDDDPSAFTNCYGAYCVTGHIRQSSFCAVSVYSSEDAADLGDFAASLGVTGQTKSDSLNDASMLIRKAESHSSSIQESHKFLIDGAEGGRDLTWLQDGNLVDAWHGFRSEYKPIPHVALLNHYSSVLVNKIPRPTRYYDVPFNPAEAIWKCAILQMEARSATGRQNPFAEVLENIHKRLSVLSSSREPADLAELRQIADKLNTLKDSIRSGTHARAVARPTLRSELEKLVDQQSVRYAECVNTLSLLYIP